MASLPEPNINAIGSAHMHTSSRTKVLSDSDNYQEHGVTSTRFPIPITGPGTRHLYSPPHSPTFSPDPVDRGYLRRSPCHLKQPSMASVPSIRDDKYSHHVSRRSPVEYLPSTYSSNFSGHSRDTPVAAGTCIFPSSPDALLQHPSGTYGETHPALSPMPGYVTSYQYKDFVLYPGCGHNGGGQCSHPQSIPAHGTRDAQPPRAPYIGRLATPELGEEEICSRSTDSMYKFKWENKYMEYEEDEERCLPPVMAGMFLGL
ncbi:hypothetical protein EV426DRAFT_65934 [Tirmania nivea]|nr:hypothetical protein EV426DRAFT_65934 [Tirmania nivea]